MNKPILLIIVLAIIAALATKRFFERDVVSPETFRYEIYFKSLSDGGITKTIVDENPYRSIPQGSKGTPYMQKVHSLCILILNSKVSLFFFFYFSR